MEAFPLPCQPRHLSLPPPLLMTLILGPSLTGSFVCVVAGEPVLNGSVPGYISAAGGTNGAPESGLPALKVWLSALSAILVISLVGLAGVAAVPLVRSTYYNHFIQYLVALAVGSLTGDAMLHLLPHAIVKSAMEASHLQRWHSERQTVLKGLAALGGVYCFFIAERLVVLAAEHRSERQALLEQQRAEPSSSLSEGRASIERHRRRVSRMYGEKSCGDIITTGLGSKALRSIDNFRSLLELEEVDGDVGVGCSSTNQRCSKLLRPELSEADEVAEEETAELSAQSQPPALEDAAAEESDTAATVPLAATAGSVDAIGGRSLAPMAWMVILGDGLHNFADGLAVGSAFAQSITGGVSTSVAVLCHELPHELGDFAVLLKTGMPARRALLCNAASSLLALIGAAIGVCAANASGASYWMFAATAGVFVYISLVGMLPELNLLHVHAGESRLAHFALQNAGIATGVGLMCAIAMFEGDIRAALGDPEH